jgi:phosphoglycolate phosphatase
MASQKKTLIFDFDGTLADTFGIAISVFRKLARKWHDTGDDEIERLRSLPAREALKQLGVRWWHLPYIIYEGRRAVKQQMETVVAIKGIPPVVKALHERGYQLLIISSNSTKNINRFLVRNNLNEYFDGVWGGKGIFAKGAAIKEIALRSGLSLQDCTYIGDEVRDVDASKHAGIPYVVVSWGYNNRKALETAKAETLIDKPEELLKLFP